MSLIRGILGIGAGVVAYEVYRTARDYPRHITGEEVLAGVVAAAIAYSCAKGEIKSWTAANDAKLLTKD